MWANMSRRRKRVREPEGTRADAGSTVERGDQATRRMANASSRGCGCVEWGSGKRGQYAGDVHDTGKRAWCRTVEQEIERAG